VKPDSPIKLVSELLDLPLYDSEGKYSGIVDDVEFSGTAGKALKLKALLVGPGAYAGRLPRWMAALARRVAGDRVIRVPLDRIRTIETAVHLKCGGGELGLYKSERVAARWIPHKGAL
jgi:sporulation protein YlmC with PRC-barrel domain